MIWACLRDIALAAGWIVVTGTSWLTGPAFAQAPPNDLVARMKDASQWPMAARDYANTRKAFGQPIGAFQSVKHRIAELYGLVEIARANCIHAASREGSRVPRCDRAARSRRRPGAPRRRTGTGP